MSSTMNRPGRAPLAAGILALALVGGLVGCSKPKPAPAPAPAPTAAPVPAPVSQLRVTGLTVGRVLGADKSIAQPVDTFAPTDTIYASVRTEGSAASAMLMARWTYDGTQPVEESSQAIAPAGGVNYTEFHVSKPDGWPAGNYEVEILLNGQSVQRQAFKVN